MIKVMLMVLNVLVTTSACYVVTQTVPIIFTAPNEVASGLSLFGSIVFLILTAIGLYNFKRIWNMSK